MQRVNWTGAVTDEPPAGVEAGTLLATGGGAAADLVGEGAVAIARAGGRVEIRAARDGVPVRVPEGVKVERGHEVSGDIDRHSGGRAVRGSLRVGGHVAPGAEVAATGPVRIEGTVDRAQIRAGGELQLDGRAQEAQLVGGALTALRARLHEPLHGVGDELDALVAMAPQALAVAGPRAAASDTAARIVARLAEGRFDGVRDRLDDAATILGSARRSWPGLCAGLTAQVAGAREALTRPERVPDPLAALEAAAGFLLAAVPERRRMTPIGVRLAAANRCWITTAGPLRLLGAGASGCDLDVGGDLVALGHGGMIRGGAVRCGGRVRVRELHAGANEPLRIALDAGRACDDLLQADVVGAGVEVTVRGETIRFDRRRTGVRIGIAGGRPVLAA